MVVVRSWAMFRWMDGGIEAASCGSMARTPAGTRRLSGSRARRDPKRDMRPDRGGVRPVRRTRLTCLQTPVLISEYVKFSDHDQRRGKPGEVL